MGGDNRNPNARAGGRMQGGGGALQFLPPLLRHPQKVHRGRRLPQPSPHYRHSDVACGPVGRQQRPYHRCHSVDDHQRLFMGGGPRGQRYDAAERGDREEMGKTIAPSHPTTTTTLPPPAHPISRLSNGTKRQPPSARRPPPPPQWPATPVPTVPSLEEFDQARDPILLGAMMMLLRDRDADSNLSKRHGQTRKLGHDVRLQGRQQHKAAVEGRWKAIESGEQQRQPQPTGRQNQGARGSGSSCGDANYPPRPPRLRSIARPRVVSSRWPRTAATCLLLRLLPPCRWPPPPPQPPRGRLRRRRCRAESAGGRQPLRLPDGRSW